MNCNIIILMLRTCIILLSSFMIYIFSVYAIQEVFPLYPKRWAYCICVRFCGCWVVCRLFFSQKPMNWVGVIFSDENGVTSSRIMDTQNSRNLEGNFLTISAAPQLKTISCIGIWFTHWVGGGVYPWFSPPQRIQVRVEIANCFRDFSSIE